MGSVVGGTIAGVAVVSTALALYFLRRRARAPRKFADTEKVDTQNLVYAPLDLPQSPNTAAIHPMATNTGDQFPISGPYAPPFDRFPPEIQDDSGGSGRLAFNTLMAVSPAAADRFVQPTSHALGTFPGPTIGATMPVVPFPYPASSSSTYPSTAPRESQAISITEITDADLSSPRSISPSIASTSPFLPRLPRALRDDEVQAAADLLRQRLPMNDVTRILEAMQRGEDGDGIVLSRASTSVGGGPSISQDAGQSLPSGTPDPAQPPPYHKA